MSAINKRLDRLEAAANPQAAEIFTIYFVGGDGTRIKAYPENLKEQAIYDQMVSEAKARAAEITRQDLFRRGVIQK